MFPIGKLALVNVASKVLCPIKFQSLVFLLHLPNDNVSTAKEIFLIPKHT